MLEKRIHFDKKSKYKAISIIKLKLSLVLHL